MSTRQIIWTGTVLSGRVGDATRGDVVRFRTLDSLARRAAGRRAEWRAEHETAFDPPARTVALVRPVGDAWSVVARVRVDASAMASE